MANSLSQLTHEQSQAECMHSDVGSEHGRLEVSSSRVVKKPSAVECGSEVDPPSPRTRRHLVGAAALLVFLTAAARRAAALCNDTGEPIRCMIRGRPGTRECVGGRLTQCILDEPIPQPPPTRSGLLAPKYYVLTVIYAPPGTNGGRSSSSVSYGSGSSTGTTTSTTQSFKQNYKVSASAEGGIIGKVNVGGSFAFGKTANSSQSIDVKKSNTTTIRMDGPPVDGVDHNRDQIWLWLNPRIRLTLKADAASWTFSGDQTAEIQFVFVGWLKNPSSMPPGVRQALERNGITAADYPGILSHDPFANGPSTPDPARFQSLNATLPYEPPFSAADPVPTTQINISSAWASTSGTSGQDEYEVGLSVGVSGGFFGFAKASLKNENSWKWTNTSSQSSSTGTSETAAATIGGPAFGYTGPTMMGVFFDKVYRTFLFQPVQTAALALRGRVTAAAGQALAGREVTAVVGGTTYRTFTDAKGEYRFPGQFSGPVRLQAGPVVRALPQAQPDQLIELPLQ